ncbi:hypothetical protein ACFQ61_27070 [Streptomyces sp. NPDC056500]|uniref:hypothetical protein n=1 Tax=Streptomyces sp. NPDC056500 TaxID=3345840 RepID=UPI0036ABA9B4
MISSPPKLRDELEVIRGMDDIPLIFDPVTGNYHRITRAGEVVLTFLDGTRTREDLVVLLSRADEARAEALTGQIDTFLAALDKSGLLEGSALPERPQESGRVRTSMLMPRIVLTRSLPRLLEPLAAVLRRMPPKLLVLITAFCALVGYSFGFHTLFTAMPPAEDLAGPAFLIATGVMLLYVLMHESAHALVAQILGTPVRGLGVALLFYFVPVAYVDRTDAYRFRGRGGRVVLAMAGILSDGVFCGLSAVIALNSSGLLRDTAALLLGMQLLMLIVNLNPLMPSDGYTAIEAASGLTNARARAFSLLRHTIRRQELPAHLAQLSTAARRGHMAYGVFSVIYVCLLAYAMFHAVPVTVDLSLSAVGR